MEPPQWNVSVQYSRALTTGSQNAIVLGYSRIGLYQGGRTINSYLAGLQFKVAEPANVQVGYNLVKQTRTIGRNYFGATLSYYWR